MKNTLSTTVLGICAIATLGITLLNPTAAYAGEGGRELSVEREGDGERRREGDGEKDGDRMNKTDVFKEHGIHMPCDDDEVMQSVPEPSGLLGLGMLGMIGVATYKRKNSNLTAATGDSTPSDI